MLTLLWSGLLRKLFSSLSMPMLVWWVRMGMWRELLGVDTSSGCNLYLRMEVYLWIYVFSSILLPPHSITIGFTLILVWLSCLSYSWRLEIVSCSGTVIVDCWGTVTDDCCGMLTVDCWGIVIVGEFWFYTTCTISTSSSICRTLPAVLFWGPSCWALCGLEELTYYWRTA